MYPILPILCLVGLVLSPLGTARADFVYSDFTSTAGLQLNANAATVGPVLRLTPSAFWNAGSVFTTSEVLLGPSNSFSTYFRFRMTESVGIGDGDGIGADGIVFLVQTDSNAVGGSGVGIGYAGVNPSLAIEFDTFFNSGIDPSGNHVGVNTNGNLVSLASANEPTRFNNGDIWNAWIDYDGSTDIVEVRWSQSAVRPAAAQLTHVVDLDALLGQGEAFVGFTSATGAAANNHDLLSWEFRGDFSPIDVPEPSTYLIALCALGGLAACRRTSRQLAG